MITLWCKKVFYSCITVCITVFGVLGAWGGNGLELQPLVRIKTVRPAAKLRLAQKSKRQRNLNKKRTVWCVSKLVHLKQKTWNTLQANIIHTAIILENTGVSALVRFIIKK